MRTDEFIRRVTASIHDPVAALEVARELKAHLDEAVAEAVAGGADPAEAETTTVERMGDPDALALQLAGVHHRHLPWRIYLAPLPMACLATVWLALPSEAHWRVGR